MMIQDVSVYEGRLSRVVTFSLVTDGVRVQLQATLETLTAEYPFAYHAFGSDSSLHTLDRRTAMCLGELLLDKSRFKNYQD